MFIKAEIWTVGKTSSGIAALLRLPGSTRCVPVYLDNTEAQAILSALSGVKESPPRYPELFSSLSRALSVKAESVEVFKGGSPGGYRSVIHFSGKDSRFTLDARTPDALAIAVRAGIPIFLDDSIPEDDSIGVSMAEPELSVTAQLGRLRKELGLRIDEEDYEQAARIRDQINQIEAHMRTGTE